ncbi:hypothetical protein MKEN_00244900 [Mycena kentingensis (nom. inval.)]|nr:hypothetical protein MKEN_00244900 [Mycena kentingensis (nom. inval.)]
MHPSVQKACSTVAEYTLGILGLIICCPAFCVCVVCLQGNVICGTRKREPLPNPEPLSTQRIDISLGELAKQPSSSPLLSLPLELQQCIYEAALGGRRIPMHVEDDRKRKRRFVRTAGHGRMPNDAYEPVTINLLRTCRAVYLSAHPIFLTTNTFAVEAEDLMDCISAGLGVYNLPHVRSLAIVGRTFPYSAEFVGIPLYSTAALLRQMFGLRRLTLEFHDDLAWRGYTTELHRACHKAHYEPRKLLEGPLGSLLIALTTLQV